MVNFLTVYASPATLRQRHYSRDVLLFSRSPRKFTFKISTYAIYAPFNQNCRFIAPLFRWSDESARQDSLMPSIYKIYLKLF
jgi:hypothetical protein